MTDVVIQKRITTEEFLAEALGPKDISSQQRINDLETALYQIIAVLEQAKVDLATAEREADGKLNFIKRDAEPVYVPRFAAFSYGHALVEQLYERLQLRLDTALSIIRETQ
jgi:hypothetical protein